MLTYNESTHVINHMSKVSACVDDSEKSIW